MRFVHTAHDDRAVAGSVHGDWLLVRRGRTLFPVRPLTSERFLIGSGTNCHLQLGGGLPMLHSLLVRENERWVLEAVAPEPIVFVNGTACRRQVLCVEDVIRIGEFELVLCGDDCAIAPEQDGTISRPFCESAPALHEEAGNLSASELVNCLEREFRLIDCMGHTHHAGGTALLRAIQRQGDARHPRAA
ncbi:MAG: FHA domain-containing protein [Planctomycetaceae bacterium]